MRSKKASTKVSTRGALNFDTIGGGETFNNEMCFDGKTGAQVYDRAGNMELENSAFFDFAGAKLPSHIAQYRNGMLVIDVQLTRQVISDALSPDMFAPPPGSDIPSYCQPYRRSFGGSLPPSKIQIAPS